MSDTTLKIIAVSALVVIAYIAYRKHQKIQATLSLYNRLGGIFGISAVVDHFSDALITNPIVGVDSQNKYLREWNRNKLGRLPGLKFMRTLWLASLSGGPFEYSPTRPGKCPFSLENAHSSLQISPKEFDAVAAELSKSLNHFKVGEREKREVLAVFAAHKGEIIAGYDKIHGIAQASIKCS